MAYEQTLTLNLNLYSQVKFAERCIGFVYDLARWGEANQARSRAPSNPQPTSTYMFNLTGRSIHFAR